MNFVILTFDFGVAKFIIEQLLTKGDEFKNFLVTSFQYSSQSTQERAFVISKTEIMAEIIYYSC